MTKTPVKIPRRPRREPAVICNIKYEAPARNLSFEVVGSATKEK